MKQPNHVARNARIAKGYTQKQIASMLGMTVRSYQRFEHGERNLSTDKLFRLAEILGVSVYELAGKEFKTA
ncbi:helix-turn-helix domain-containing protein [Alicyclobacillus sendaiensis]|uniref:Helix-turn-helix transcriptional regulator n=1 Tax=Alicyclobacillus sendaiensis PA2 TaxID=3029425 RepID=A0ABT6Y1R8_ALISE|nr:helix-turn-helix transcriptional regulator [Alicyclobacillus sendaiensis]MDI9261298.1 helix-turn-helix transcriptional regulator [Alicyclobacillus sendaiensis PA2]